LEEERRENIESVKELKVRDRRNGKGRVNEQKKCLKVCFRGSEFHREHFNF